MLQAPIIRRTCFAMRLFHGVLPIFPFSQVKPKGSSGDFTQVHHAPFAVLGSSFDAVLDFHFAALDLNVTYLEGTQFQGSQTRIHRNQDDRLLQKGGWPAHHIFMAHVGVGFTRIQASLEHTLDFILGERLYRGLLDPRRGDVFHGVCHFEL
jgi:hypothetical protein